MRMRKRRNRGGGEDEKKKERKRKLRKEVPRKKKEGGIRKGVDKMNIEIITPASISFNLILFEKNK